MQGKTTFNPTVCLKTSLGDITLALFADKAPITVKNFISYVESGFYDDTIFHRVIDNFMIQGGGFTQDMTQKPTQAPIKNEAAAGLSNLNGTIAMARTDVVDSATAQFFINIKDNRFLDHRDDTPQGFGYAVFGKVIAGGDVLDKMRQVETGHKDMHDDVPVNPIIINSALLVN